ncbi:MAG: hypothetical protein A2905_05605 [Candidatus Levybacteria bacterium RIFCSPLOWO2_01_FULL_36_10]|nr:MAG: hypothetical protein A2905_05605 [Candidatus Levybacteria bacterium RIFCSPLOWO2_01_FULL_36_10]
MTKTAKKILIIDDDTAILEALKICMEECGYKVETLSKVKNPKNILDGSIPDLILLDLRISGSDGGQIAKVLKKDGKTKNIPIIMISAHPSGKKAAIEAGVDHFVEKPFELNYLLDKIERLI